MYPPKPETQTNLRWGGAVERAQHHGALRLAQLGQRARGVARVHGAQRGHLPLDAAPLAMSVRLRMAHGVVDVLPDLALAARARVLRRLVFKIRET